jgi:hypothetical protein
VPLVMLLTVLYGDTVVPHLGWWAWPLLIVLAVIVTMGASVRSVRIRVFDLLGIEHD